MASAINKIFSGKADEEVHAELIKFGKGVFTNKYLVEGKKQKDKWAVKTGAEFANFFVRKCLEEVQGKIKVKGIIVSTLNMQDKAKFEISNVKKFMGIKQLVLDTETDPKNIIDFMNEFPRAFFALSFSTPKSDLKIKAKAPKSAKPAATGEKEPKPEFCSLKTSNSETIKDVFFDFPEFTEIKINHTLKINEIIIPKNEKDPVMIREKSMRKGIVERKVTVDGKEVKKESAFEI